jgi:tRNA (guanine26-N2/guanine27-N2)-dimethyltransferase
MWRPSWKQKISRFVLQNFELKLDNMKENTLIKRKEASVEFYIYAQDYNRIPTKSMNVFYNEKMILNRDLTSLAIGVYKNLYKITNFDFIDSMAASGIASLRLLKEYEDLGTIYINDINPLAVDLINKNIHLNNIDRSKVKISKRDANSLFSELSSPDHNHPDNLFKKVDIISIDPFGTPNSFVDMAFKAIRRKHGLLCITATDTAVLFGVKPKVCMRKYMSKSLHSEYCKEIGARILVHFISRIANINDLGIIPLLTFYSNHFIRVFLLTIKRKKEIIHNFSNYGYIFHCNGCGYRSQFSNDIFQLPQSCPLCEETNKLTYSGPLWIGDLHQSSFLKQILSLNKKKFFLNKKVIDKKISYALEELEMPPYYYNIHNLCQELKLPIVPKIEEVIINLKERDFIASRTHFDYLAIKTTANQLELKRILSDITINNKSGSKNG